MYSKSPLVEIFLRNVSESEYESEYVSVSEWIPIPIIKI
jgi:hypothetical protein